MIMYSKRPRRNLHAKPLGEPLESRSLLTGGAGNTFALSLASTSTPNGSVAINFTVDPAQFTLPRHAFTLGVDVAATTGSTAKPFISSIGNPHGDNVPQTFHSIYDPHLLHSQVANGVGTNAVLSPISFRPHNFTSPVTYTVNVDTLNNTNGAFLTGFYLPGDANGDGQVNQSDVQIVKSDLGAVAGDSRYNFDADANRDGRIGLIDLAFTRQNLGVKTTVVPVVTANLDPASDSGAADRITNIQTVHFSGQATPAATVTYTEAANKTAPVHTTADANGFYNVNIPLGQGANNFTVTSVDGFGQSISGQITPVTFTPDAPKVSAETIKPAGSNSTGLSSLSQ